MCRFFFAHLREPYDFERPPPFIEGCTCPKSFLMSNLYSSCIVMTIEYLPKGNGMFVSTSNPYNRMNCIHLFADSHGNFPFPLNIHSPFSSQSFSSIYPSSFSLLYFCGHMLHTNYKRAVCELLRLAQRARGPVAQGRRTQQVQTMQMGRRFLHL